MSTLNLNPEAAGGNAEQGEARERVQLQEVGRMLLREIRRLDLNYREYQLAELLLEMSYGWGLKSLVVPKLELWSQLTGVAKPHVHTYLNQLAEMKIITISPDENGPRYALNPDMEHWRCRLKIPRATIKEALRTLKLHNGLDDPDFFEYGLHGQIPLFHVTESGTVTNANPTIL